MPVAPEEPEPEPGRELGRDPGLDPEREEGRYSRARLVATLVVLVLFTETAPLELSLVYPAVRSMASEFGPDHVDKAVTAVNLAAVVSIPLVGRLADLYGKKRMMLCCGGLFAVGSLFCALAPTLPVLLLGRVFQGAVGGILAVAYALIRDVFPRRTVPVALGIVSTGIGISGLGAPFLGGALVDGFGFRGVFWFLLALVLVMLPLAALILPESPIRQCRSLDAPGALLLGAGAAVLLAGVGVGAREGWLSGPTVGTLAGGAVLLAGFVARERTTPEPAVDLRVLASPALRTPLIAAFFGVSLIGTFGYLLPQVLQTPPHGAISYGVGLTAFATAGWLFPQGLMSMLGGPLGGLLARRHSPRLGLMAALVLLSSALLLSPRDSRTNAGSC
ncbi:MFS transporter [Streptomyces iconiensis]|uniref:MFS transporter n=1 Tax=Streptomyces iconiensis TaxID=1384038 RepID=A0ABT7A7M5_9ACTN|nr:MFS transporter [Streptomyces iconiensis]MDJ1136633.1 MFS transporter [Streptomyces iconiensis]